MNIEQDRILLEDKKYIFQYGSGNVTPDIEDLSIVFKEDIFINGEQIFEKNKKYSINALFTNNESFKNKKNVACGYSILQFTNSNEYEIEGHEGRVYITKVKNPIIQMGDDELIREEGDTGEKIKYISKKYGTIWYVVNIFEKEKVSDEEETISEEESDSQENESEETEEVSEDETERTNEDVFREDFKELIDDGFEVYIAGENEEYRLLYKEGADPILLKINDEDSEDSYTFFDYDGDIEEEGITKHLFVTDFGEKIKFNRKNVDR